MKHFLFKVLLTTSSLVMFPIAYAQNNNVEVTPLAEVTPQELAALHVLNDICPTLVKDQQSFQKGYQRFLGDYLPHTKNPLQQLQTLSQHRQFQAILTEAKNDAKQAGDIKNTEICQEISVYTP